MTPATKVLTIAPGSDAPVIAPAAPAAPAVVLAESPIPPLAERFKGDVVKDLNRDHAVVLLGTGPVIMHEDRGADGQLQVRPLSEDGFKAWLRPYKVDRGESKVPVASIWLGSRERRTYTGICFDPTDRSPELYNLWRGFAVEPSAPAPDNHPRRAERFLAHIEENVCQGDEKLAAWVIGWFAHLVQHPAEKPGTALVLQGSQGTGKTIVGKAMGRILGPHYTVASDARFVTGRFNSHLQRTLLLQAEEAFWAGDHAAEGKLKDLITGSRHQLEYKGREPVEVANHVRLLITSNAGWVVPAGLEERRFAVLKVGNGQRQNGGYFGAIVRDLESGGDADLLRYLLDFDVSTVDVRTVPATAALHEQKLRSLEPLDQWWLDVLHTGVLPGDRFGTGVTRTKALHAAYVEHAKMLGVPRRSNETQLGRYLHTRLPDLARELKKRVTLTTSDGPRRDYVYEFPPLAECRAGFDAAFTGTGVEWADPDATWGAVGAGGSP